MLKRTAVAAIALTLAPAAFAQTYIVPDSDCGAVTLRATSAAPVADAYVFLPTQRIAVTPEPADGSLQFKANVPDAGLVRAAIDFKPVIVDDETRTEHAKAFVYCGAAPTADWVVSSGLGFEIYPQWNGLLPRMKMGDTMRFIAVDKASRKLVSDAPMEMYRVGGDLVATGTVDRNGGMNFPYPEPGRYMVTATYRRADPQQPQHWLVDTSTLTFEVK